MTPVRTVLLTLAVAIAALSIGACDKVPSNALQSCEAAQVTPGSVKTDILFVIDESGSMSDERIAVRAALGDFVAALAASPVKNDFQIGVITTAVVGAASDGALIGTPKILSGGSSTLVNDFQATISGITAPSGFWQEQPFQSMKLAIQKSAPGFVNEGFIRSGSRLAIFFMSDEDDCSVSPPPGTGSPDCWTKKSSLYPVSDYVAFLKSPIPDSQGEVKDVVMDAIAGFSQIDLALSCGQPQCTNQTCSTADDKGDRFLALSQAFGSGGRVGSICSPTLSQSLLGFAGIVMSQTMPLEGAPADPRLLVATVTKATGEVVTCGTVAEAGNPAAATANAVYTPPLEGHPASITFQHACALGHGDRVDVKVICAG